MAHTIKELTPELTAAFFREPILQVLERLGHADRHRIKHELEDMFGPAVLSPKPCILGTKTPWWKMLVGREIDSLAERGRIRHDANGEWELAP